MQRERKMKFSDMSFRQKVEHIWEYYKLILLGIALGIGLIIYIIVKVTHPDPEILLNVTMVNSMAYNVEDSTFFDDFMVEQGYDTSEETIFVNGNMYLNAEGNGQTDMASYQALTAMIMVGEIDVLCGDKNVFDLMGGSGGLEDIKNILPADLLEKYKDKIYTATNGETGETFECGIWLPEGNPLTEDLYYTGPVLVGIPYSTDSKELAQELLLKLLNE